MVSKDFASWRPGVEENRAEQKKYQESTDPDIVARREAEEEAAEKAMSQNPMTIGVANFGKTNTKDTEALRYPSKNSGYDIGPTSDYVAFEFYEYVPPFKAGVGRDRKRYNASVTDSDDGGLLGDKVGSVLLYMPEDIQSEYGADWGGAGFGLLSKALMGAAANAVDLNFNVGQAFQDGMTAAGGATKRALVDKIVKKANESLGTSVTTNQALGGVEGKIVNPNIEMMYEAPQMRGFSLNFKMFASTSGEADEIARICNMFKKNMLPRFDPAFIKIPNIVRVTFMTGSNPNKYVSQFKPCAITNVNINYTPDGAWATYADGRPVATQLTLQFKELKIVFSDDIKEGGPTY